MSPLRACLAMALVLGAAAQDGGWGADNDMFGDDLYDDYFGQYVGGDDDYFYDDTYFNDMVDWDDSSNDDGNPCSSVGVDACVQQYHPPADATSGDMDSVQKQCDALATWLKCLDNVAHACSSEDAMQDAIKNEIDVIKSQTMTALADIQPFCGLASSVSSGAPDWMQAGTFTPAPAECPALLATPPPISMSGHCAPDANQVYKFAGTTADGRPYYEGVTTPGKFLYYDHKCSEDTYAPAWILGPQPDPTKSTDLEGADGQHCPNDGHFDSTACSPPLGEQPWTFQWCGDQGIFNQPVTLTQAAQEVWQERRLSVMV